MHLLCIQIIQYQKMTNKGMTLKYSVMEDCDQCDWKTQRERGSEETRGEDRESESQQVRGHTRACIWLTK